MVPPGKRLVVCAEQPDVVSQTASSLGLSSGFVDYTAVIADECLARECLTGTELYRLANYSRKSS